MRVKAMGWAAMALLGLGSAVALGADPTPLWKLGDTTDPAAFKKLIKATERDEIRALPLVLTSTLCAIRRRRRRSGS